MNKQALAKFAPQERNNLRESVARQLERLGITPESDYKNFTDWLNDQGGLEALNHRLKLQYPESTYQDLFTEYQKSGYEALVEETAYTWFNRLIAIRYMEVNNVLPDKVNIIGNSTNAKLPDILNDYDYLDMNRQEIETLKFENQEEQAYKQLFITAINKLGDTMPFLFDKLQGWTELLLPEKMLEQDSIIDRIVNNQELTQSFESGVESIGWLYQFYNSELKDQVFKRPKNKKIEKADIPPATQLFTPEWIVKYMVENSLGRFYIDMLLANPAETRTEKEIAQAFGWKYYLENAEQIEEVNLIIQNDREEKAQLTLENLKVIDPSMGSGHILVYAFDVLLQIYEDQGYSPRNAVPLILEKNIFGLDIDKRAAQLAYFALMMKARASYSRFFRNPVHPNVFDVFEVNAEQANKYKPFIDLSALDKTVLANSIDYLYNTFQYGKELGSLITVDSQQIDLETLERFLEEQESANGNLQLTFEMTHWDDLKKELSKLMEVAKVFAQKYEVAVTNPPYMGSSGFGKFLADFAKKNYPISKSDLFAIFIERLLDLSTNNGYVAMITMHAFMFLSSYEKLRQKLQKCSFINMAHLGARAFEEIGGEVVQTTAFVLENKELKKRIGSYMRLVDLVGQQPKMEAYLSALSRQNANGIRFDTTQENFEKIPGSPISYWVSEKFIENFNIGELVDNLCDFTGSQHKTADNERFLRNFWEVSVPEIGENMKWVLYTKGGDFRKWYGNISLVIDWSEQAKKFYINNPTSNMLSERYHFQEGITYTSLTSGSQNGFRYLPNKSIFDIKGPSLVRIQNLYYLLALFNSKVAPLYLKTFNSTITLQVRDVKSLPIIVDENMIGEVDKKSKLNVTITKEDWDSFETSLEFKYHPLI